MTGGQRRRLGVARALIAGCPVLVLDEPTADVDPATADAPLVDLVAAAKGRTLVLVAHTTAGLVGPVDEVVEFEDGAVRRRTLLRG